MALPRQTNAAPEWQAGSMWRLGSELMAACPLEGLVRRCRSSTDNVREPSHRLQHLCQSRAYQWNHLASMAAVDVEVAIGSEKQWRVVDLRQTNQRSISK